MCAHNAARNCETQARSACAAVARFLTAVETFEDMWDIFSTDALTGVADCRFDAFVCSPRRDVDLPSSRCVPQRVTDQIIQHAADGLCIHSNRIYIRFHP